MDDDAAQRRRSRLTAIAGVLLVLLVAVAAGWLAGSVQKSGHFWGDDFALYIRQALSLHDGSWQQVIDDNRFSLEHSGWHTFSPYLYPWGFPLMLAPLVGDWAFDYDSLKVVGVVSMALFVFGFNRVIVPRSGYWPALALTGLFAVSLPYLRMTEAIQSDLPFAAVAMLTLWAIDGTHRRGRWQQQRAWRLIGLGVLVAWAFTIRREGLALLLAVAACQTAEVWRDLRGDHPEPLGQWLRSGVRPRLQTHLRALPWLRLALPHLVFVACVWGLQLALPSAIAPGYPGTGPWNAPINALFYLREFAMHVGVSRPGAPTMEAFGSVVIGWILFVPIVWCLVVGVVTRLRRHLRVDLPVLAFFVASAGLVLQLPFRDGRYALSLTPIIAWLATEGAVELVGRRFGKRRARLAVTLLVAPGVVAGGFAVADVADTIAVRNATGAQVWGPTAPASLELWEAVEEHTDPDDVVAFFRSRLMTLQTGRRSLQASHMDPILDHADWFAWEKASEYSQPDPPEVAEAIEAAGLEIVWENRRFALLRIPGDDATG